MSMLEDEVDGYFLLGQNPAVGSAHGKMQRLGMAHLKWLVVRDLNMIESATFWKDGPEIETGELVTEDIGTEVFFFPAASHVEKDGSFTQTQRMLQWHHKAVEPPGECQSDLQFFYLLGKKLQERLAESTDERDRPLLDLTWDYPLTEDGEIKADAVLQEINGVHLSGDKAGQPLSTYLDMADDGSTSGGCWIYTGVYADGVNQAARRKPGSEQSWVAPDWGWAWPANRRILYNRASADPDGKPWSERKAYVWWDEDQQKWTGHDVPDFEATKPPTYRPDPDAGGVEALAGDDPFVMQSDGKGWLFAPAGLVGRTAAGPLRAVRVAGAQPALHPAGQPGPRGVPAQGQSAEPLAAGTGLGRVPVRVHDLPAHRTPHGRWHEPLAAVPVGAAAGVLLRGVPRTRPGARPGEPRLGHDRHRTHGDRGPRAGHRADDPVAAGRADGAPGRICPITGAWARRRW